MSEKGIQKNLKEYKKKEMDTVSSSFCAAKWLYSTIWLYNGTTSSCHHPRPHKISLKEVLRDPSCLHNTEIKKKSREQMLKGERPRECEYCWGIEDSQKDSLSDRVFKTQSFSLNLIHDLKNKSPKTNINPEVLEIAFSRNCNLACSYCCSSYSSSWDKFSKNSNSPYPYSKPFSDSNSPFVKIFWKWLPHVTQGLESLRITGGEPLLSKDFWNLLDWFIVNKPDTRLTVNTNLCASDELIDRLIKKGRKIKNFEIYTSCEALNEQAEYLRDGMYFKKFWYNCKKVSAQFNLYFMVTVNALSLLNLTDFLNEIENLKGHDDYPKFFINILKHPSFMSIDILPESIRNEHLHKLKFWYDKRKDLKKYTDQKYEYEYELDSLKTLIASLNKRQEFSSIEVKKFKTFFEEYDRDRGKNIIKTFPEIKDIFSF